MIRRLVSVAFTTCLTLTLLAGPVGAQSPARLDVLIRFASPPTSADLALVRGHGGSISRQFRIVPAVAATLPLNAVEALAHNPRVELIEPDGLLYALEYRATHDWGVGRVRADAAHRAGHTGEGVRVAVIDSGIDCDHVELAANCQHGWNYVANSPNADDDYGHGTHVSGTIAAAINGTTDGVVGVAPAATVVAYKTLDSGGVGSWSRHIAAIEDIWNEGTPTAQVVNMSIGRGDYSSVAEDAMLRAYESGVLLVAAAGNSGRCNGKGTNISYPALFTSVIAVAATDASDQRACWSSTGDKVELSAPGVSVFSTWPANMSTSYRDPQPVCQDLDTNGTTETCHYKYGSGTSMSSPHVAGVAALLMGAGAVTDADRLYGVANEVRQRMTDAARDLGTAGRDSLYGFGLVDAEAALAGTGGGDENQAPVASDDSASTVAGSAVTIDVLANDSDPDGDLLSPTAVSDPASGSASAHADGTIRYEPDAGFTGTDTFTYQATDGQAASNTATVTVRVDAAPPPSEITLSATSAKVRGVVHVDLAWSGASGSTVDVYRDGALIATTANDGGHLDNTGARGSGSFTYRVCNAGTSTCSSAVAVSF